jgi:hypothetical protein
MDRGSAKPGDDIQIAKSDIPSRRDSFFKFLPQIVD